MRFRRFPPAVDSFNERHEFSGSLRLGDKTLGALEVVVDVSKRGQRVPQGYIIGNNETAHSINTLWRERPKEAVLLVEGVDASSSYRGEIEIDQVQWRGHGPQGPTGIVCEFKCREFTVSRELGPGDEKVRHLVVFLTGTAEPWKVSWISVEGWDGTKTLEVLGGALDLGVAMPFSLLIRPYFFYSREEKPVAKSIHAIVVVAETDVPKDELSDEQFVQMTTKLVDDASLLVSLLSGVWITWYGYSLATPSRVTDHARRIRRPGAHEVDAQDTPVPSHVTRAFLKTAVPALRSLRDHGGDLHLAIADVVAGRETISLEERFTNFIFALEKLKDIHAAMKGREFIVDEGKWKTLQGNLGEVIRGAADRGEVSQAEAASLTRKLPDIRRPAFAETFEDMLKTYRGSWRDLYPEEMDTKSPPFIGVRDKLVHSNRSVAPQRLWYESLRVQAVVERVLLRMLGWENVDYSPRSYFREVLQSELGE